MPCGYGKTLRRQQAVDLSSGRIIYVIVLGSKYLFKGLTLLSSKSFLLLLDMRSIGFIRKPNQASAAWMYVESDGFACCKDTTQMTRDSQVGKDNRDAALSYLISLVLVSRY